MNELEQAADGKGGLDEGEGSGDTKKDNAVQVSSPLGLNVISHAGIFVVDGRSSADIACADGCQGSVGQGCGDAARRG